MEKKKLDLRIDENGCFIVISHRPNKDGYCYMWHERKAQRIHRLVYKECFGEVADDIVIRHKCDVRNCINPEHLESGTHAENMNDACIRGRNALGEKNGRSVINEEKARKIKMLLRDGLPTHKIAESLGVSCAVVWAINRSKSASWKHVVIS